MKLFKSKDLLKSNSKLSYVGGDHFVRFLMFLLRFDKLNSVFNKIGDRKGFDFVSELIKILKIKIAFDEDEVHKRIPKTGAAILICNYPFGGLESILLIRILGQVRSDLKIIPTQMLHKIDQISEYFVEEEPFLKKNDKNTSETGLEEATEHLESGGILCLFPAAEVSRFESARILSDPQWQYQTLKFIKSMKVQVIPVHFQGNNSRLFYILSNIHPSLKKIKLPTEILYHQKQPVKIRIGNSISVAEQDNFTDIYQYGRYLRAKTYLLSSKIEVRRFFNYSLKRQHRIEPIAEALPREKIVQELQNLGSECLVFRMKNYSVYCVPSKLIPNILLELGRLRELTFRQVGEGTNRSIDLDEFDLYYNQMFIWDNDTQMIVGAYRIGKGAEIIHKFGVRGFYIQSLFRIKDDLRDMLRQTLELGRSFVVKEYQKKPLPLFLLWKGILYFALKNPEYRYLMGPVSVSDNYSTSSKEMIIKFIMTHHFDWKLAKSITPRHSYKFKSDDHNLNVIMQSMENDINSLDKFIGNLDEMHSGLPVLLKKYIKLNAKIIGFNVDPKFNNSLDGLISLDLNNIPENTIESLSKEANDGSILEQFYSRKTDKMV